MVALIEEAEWALAEFGQAELGDKRRTARLVELASVLGSRPQVSLPQACADPARLKAAYRFFSNEAIEVSALLASHVAATQERIGTRERILAVQDTTYVDWSGPASPTLLVHSTLAFTPERVPLGLLAQDTWTREEPRSDHKERPIEDKESYKWLKSLQAVCGTKQACPQTQFVSVGDREADVYDLFVQERPAGVDLLVRAAQDRRVADAEQTRLRAAVGACAVGAQVCVEVPRQGARVARTATLDLRWCALTLRPPKARADEDLPTVQVWAVWATETAPPAQGDPLDWLLLTTVPVHTAAQAVERLQWYATRWGIEVFHKVLKSGCAIERRQLEDVDHLQRCLTLFSVVAWRLLYATLLTRVAPTLPCTALLDPCEWQALYCQIHQTTTLPPTIPALAQAVRWIAQLGGYLGRPADGPPGVTVLWRGFQRLVDLTAMYRVFRPAARPYKCG